MVTSKGNLGCVCSRSHVLTNAAHVVRISYVQSGGPLPTPVICTFKAELARLSVLTIGEVSVFPQIKLNLSKV